MRFKSKLSVRFAQHSQHWELFCEYPDAELELLSDTLKMADFILVKWKLNTLDTPEPILWWILPLLSRDYGKVLYSNTNRAEYRTCQKAVATALQRAKRQYIIRSCSERKRSDSLWRG